MLTKNELRSKSPAIFAEEAHPQMTKRYQFVKTIDIVDALSNLGWDPERAQQGRLYSKSKINPSEMYGMYGQHLVNFRHKDYLQPTELGDSIPELTLINSHNGTAKFDLHLGLYRLVCSNGLVAPVPGMTSSVNFKHYHSCSEHMDTIYECVKNFDSIYSQVHDMEKSVLTPGAKRDFASKAISLRWGEGYSSVGIDALLQPKREDDEGSSLWKTFNVIQENLFKGKVKGETEKGRKLMTRGITNIDTQIVTNKKLWELALTYANN